MENNRKFKISKVIICYILITIVCHVIAVNTYNLIFMGVTISLVLTGVLLGIGTLIINSVKWCVEKRKNRNDLQHKQQLKKDSKIVLCAVAGVLLVINFFVGLVMIFGEDPFYVIFQGADPYKIKTEYDEEWMIDKTYDEIVERYGEFDRYAAYAIKYEDDMDDEDSPTVYLILTFDEGEDGVLDGHDVCIGTRRGKQ